MALVLEALLERPAKFEVVIKSGVLLMGHHEHQHNSKPPGWGDLLLGAVAFLLVSEGVFLIVEAIKPGILSAEALFEMRLCGGLFFLVWAFVGKVVFEPFVAAAIEREEATVGASGSAQQALEEVAALESSLEVELRDARLEGIRLRDEQIDVAKKKAAAALDEAKQNAAKQLAGANESLQELRAAAQQELEQEAQSLKKLVVDKVVTESRALH